MARMRATTEQAHSHLIRPTTHYGANIEALRAAPTRIAVVGGATSKGQLANRATVALAEYRVGCRESPPASEVPIAGRQQSRPDAYRKLFPGDAETGVRGDLTADCQAGLTDTEWAFRVAASAERPRPR